MAKSFCIAFFVLCYAGISGCGTTGPLYIPEQRYPQPTQEEAQPAPNTPSEQLNKE